MRFKTVGFHPDEGEVEFLLAAGRRFGRFEVVVNGVFGVETFGNPLVPSSMPAVIAKSQAAPGV